MVLVDKDKLKELIRENIIREMLYLEHSRKFSPAKISRYTVHAIMHVVDFVRLISVKVDSVTVGFRDS